jgi:peptidoglycan/xylan/chitin deacetylase (PgdA/CDA1 family)
MYHSVSENPEYRGRAYYRLTTSPTRFREQVRWLRDAGYQTVDLADALERVESGSGACERAVVVTFDDGFRDFLTHAWPALAECSFTATMFLPTAFIGDERKAFRGRECLTWAEVRELSGQGVAFGAHSVNHSVLHRLPWTSIRCELRDSRRRIEDEIRQPVTTFAYPYAFPQENRSFVARFRSELLEQGYQGGVTTVVGRLLPRDDRLCMKRLPVNDCDDRWLFAGKLAGAYDWVGGLQGLFRSFRRRDRTGRLA